MVQGQERLRTEHGGDFHQFSLEDARPRKFPYFPPRIVIFLGAIGWESRVVLNDVFVERLPTRRRNDLAKWMALNDFDSYFAGKHESFRAGIIFRAYAKCLRQRTLTPTELMTAYSIALPFY